MTKTATVSGTVRQEAKDRLQEIVRESGRPEEELVGEAVERLLYDDYWVKETQRRLDRPEHERLGYDPADMDRYVKARVSGKSVAVPEAKPLSEL